MLIGFYKIHEEKDCDCRIIKFSDRIWLLDKAGNAQIKRAFIVEVNKKSKTSLKKIRIGTFAQDISDLINLNQECFNKNLIFNSPNMRTTSQYQILTMPNNNKNYGYIEDDVNRKVKVWSDIEVSYFKPEPNEPCCIITIVFPEPIKPGECAEVRFSFKVTALFDVVNPGSLYPVNSIILEYFAPCTIGLKDVIGRENEIKVCPQLNPLDDKHPGGFDIWLYFPPNYEKIGGFDYSYKVKHDEITEPDGSKGPKRIKIGWKLRAYPGIDNSRKSIGSGEGITISGLLAKMVDTKTTINNIKVGVTTSGKIALILGIVSIVLSVLAIIVAVILPFIIPIISSK